MIHRLIKRHKAQSGREYVVFDNGVLATEFIANHVDFEREEESQVTENIEKFLSSLPQGLLVRFSSFTDFSCDGLSFSTSRDQSISDIGYSLQGLKITVEKQLPGSKKVFKKAIKHLFRDSFIDGYIEEFDSQIGENFFSSLDLDVKPSTIEPLFQHMVIKSESTGLQIDNSFCSVIKLHKLGNYPVGLEDITTLRESLPDPHLIVTTVRKIDEQEVQILLKGKSKREESGQDVTSHRKYLASQEAIEEVELTGKSLFKIETTIILNSRHLEIVLEESFQIKNKLQSLGEFGVETVGAYPSFISSLVGGKPTYQNIEIIDRVPAFLPLAARGVDLAKLSPSKGSFLFHRLNGSIDYCDPFDKDYDNYSGYIVGKSGRGKSVFINTMLQCLHNDPKTKIILVDVKGSHTNTVEKLGGRVHKINTKNKTSMSPFQFLNSNRSPEMIEILSDFLEKMLLEDGEKSLSRAEQSRLEKALDEYISKNPKSPSLKDFALKVKDIPRVDNLYRYVDGIYSQIFSYNPSVEDPRLEYFDFTNIVTAQKGGIGPAIMSAIMAHFNYKLMSKETDEKLIFIADETPFFVESCFSSFNLLMKNVRKLHGSVLLVAQNLSDLVLEGDTSLINQPTFRVFFAPDNKSKEFAANSRLKEESLRTLESLEFEKGKYSQFLISDKFGERVGNLYLSREEYYRATTESFDRSQIEKVKESLNLKSDNEALELLANVQRGEHEVMA